MGVALQQWGGRWRMRVRVRVWVWVWVAGGWHVVIAVRYLGAYLRIVQIGWSPCARRQHPSDACLNASVCASSQWPPGGGALKGCTYMAI